MVSLGNFNATQVEPATDFEPLPDGKYLAVITDSEKKDNRARTGRYLQLTFQVIEGDHKGRFVWARLNLENPNETAVKIAEAELSAICHAVGVMEPDDSERLHDTPLVIAVRRRKRPDTGEFTNEIKGYYKQDAGKPVQATKSTPPWRRVTKEEIPF